MNDDLLTSHAPWTICRAAALVLALAVIIGAFGAHGLKELIGPERDVYQTGVFYQVVHGFGLMFTGVLLQLRMLPNTASKRIAALFIFGAILFSGSLYGIAITKLRFLGIITPFGGVAFIIGWFMVFINLCSRVTAVDDRDIDSQNK